MPSNVLDPFFYPGTRTHRNREGIRDEIGLELAEHRAYVGAAASLPPAGFVPDMRGLKGVHRHLFGDVYEWAGCARHEPMTVEGERRLMGLVAVRQELVSEFYGYHAQNLLPLDSSVICDFVDERVELRWGSVDIGHELQAILLELIRVHPANRLA